MKILNFFVLIKQKLEIIHININFISSKFKYPKKNPKQKTLNNQWPQKN